MRIHFISRGKLLALAAALAASSLPALGSTCTNPCTGSSSTGQDSTDRSNFESDNSTLSFSNITFDNATGTYGAATGLDATTAPSAQLYGLSFIGCLSNWSDCASNSSGVTVGPSASFFNGATFLNWDGGADPILTGPAPNGPGQLSTLTITLPANVFAVGLDILNNGNSSASTPFGVIVNGGSQLNSATQIQLPGSVFFGYSSATALTSLTIFPENQTTALGIDNVDVGFLGAGGGGGGSAAPESTTMLLVAGGLFMLRFARKIPGLSR
jgi:hypothetical protein